MLDQRLMRQYAAEMELRRFRALPWYRRAWLTLTGKAPR